jgi:hypothetical protein
MLRDTDRAILDLEARRYIHGGTKVRAIRDELGLTPTRYYQALSRLIDTPAAALEQPVLVNRLRRQRARGMRQRTPR